MLTAEPGPPQPAGAGVAGAEPAGAGRRPGRRRGRVSTLVALRRTGDRPPLLVVCAGHGDVLAVAHLAKLLDDDQPCFALQAPLDLELPQGELFDALVRRYLADIRSVASDGAVVLAGNSCGGYLALELARRLARQGDPPLVALLDTPCRISATNYALDRAGRALGHALARRLDTAAGGGHRRAGVPRWLDTVAAMWTDRGHEVHVAATAGHRPARYPGRLVLFRAQVWRLGGVTPRGFYVSARRWARVADGGLRTIDVPGHHWSFLREPRVRVLAERLEAVLAAREEAG